MSPLIRLLLIVFFPFFLLSVWLPFRILVLLKKLLRKDRRTTIAFFHPYCNAGGGGERVLWTCIKALHDTYGSNLRCVIYTGDSGVTPNEILQLTKKRFNITIERPVEFIFLSTRAFVEDKNYPFLTLIGQSLGSLVLGFEALFRFTPDIFFDSMGYAFSFPIFKLLGGCKVGCYVHYPTISTDMLEKVKQREESYNNKGAISKSTFFSQLKFYYYVAFAAIYGFMGSFSDIVMVNSSWTQNHINKIWKIPERTFKVFPPCDTLAFQNFPLEKRENLIVSVAQFRPEKNHKLQLHSLAAFFRKCPKLKGKVQLVLVGSCRNEEDENRIKELKNLMAELKLEGDVKFAVNATFDELRGYLSRGLVGLHSMWNEHFGIGIVEYMAAGLIPLAHKSGGPLMDIVTTGYLAQDAEEYSSHLEKIFTMDAKARMILQKEARKQATTRFSEEIFNKNFLAACKPIIKT